MLNDPEINPGLTVQHDGEYKKNADFKTPWKSLKTVRRSS